MIEEKSQLNNFGYGASTASCKVEIYLGAKKFDEFPLDLTPRRHNQYTDEITHNNPIISHPALKDSTRIALITAENHIADKLCALYEKHGRDGTSPSTRYRDLADIIRLIHVATLKSDLLQSILKSEVQRRQISLPEQIVSPDISWEKRFSADAKNYFAYPPEFTDLQKALSTVGNCLNPILNGKNNPSNLESNQSNMDNGDSPRIASEGFKLRCGW